MERERRTKRVSESRRERARVEQWAPRDDAVSREEERVAIPVVKSIASASPYLRLHPAVIPARAISDAAPAWTGVAPTQAEERPGTTT